MDIMEYNAQINVGVTIVTPQTQSAQRRLQQVVSETKVDL